AAALRQSRDSDARRSSVSEQDGAAIALLACRIRTPLGAVRPVGIRSMSGAAAPAADPRRARIRSGRSFILYSAVPNVIPEPLILNITFDPERILPFAM